MAIAIWMNFFGNNPKGEEMKLEDLKKMSTRDLTELYNKHAEKQVKRMESRAVLEERTAQLLSDAESLAGKEVSSNAPQKGESRNTNPEGIKEMNTAAKKTLKPATIGNKVPAAQKIANKAPAAKPAKAVAAKPAKPAKAASDKPAKSRGAPLTDGTYIAISEKSKNFNPLGCKLQASSARFAVYEAIKAKENGISRSKLETMFEGINVKGTLHTLTALSFINKV